MADPTLAQSSAGTTLSISAAQPATYTTGGFLALTFTEVAEIVDLGELGETYNTVTHSPLSSRIVHKFKGAYDPGELAITLAVARTDAGQVLMKTALGDDDDYSFKVTYQDGAISYFSAKVMSFKTTVGGVDSILGGTATVAINNDILEVAAP